MSRKDKAKKEKNGRRLCSDSGADRGSLWCSAMLPLTFIIFIQSIKKAQMSITAFQKWQ